MCTYILSIAIRFMRCFLASYFLIKYKLIKTQINADVANRDICESVQANLITLLKFKGLQRYGLADL